MQTSICFTHALLTILVDLDISFVKVFIQIHFIVSWTHCIGINRCVIAVHSVVGCEDHGVREFSSGLLVNMATYS